MLRTPVTDRSKSKVLASGVGIKSWLAKMPSAAEVRPPRCLGCGAASCPVGGNIVLHGQGLSERQVRGVLGLDDAAGVVVVPIRKFECQRCLAVMTVVPSELLARRQYSAPSIALALYLWLVEGLADSAVRARVCAWRTASVCGVRGWAQLYRWARSASTLFRLPRPIAPNAPPRDAAHAVLSALGSLAPIATRPLSMPECVFAGASCAATMGIASA